MVRGEISEPIAQGGMCGSNFKLYPIQFQAPIDLQPNDSIYINESTGQPLSVFRPGEDVIWVFQPQPKSKWEFTFVADAFEIDIETFEKISRAVSDNA